MWDFFVLGRLAQLSTEKKQKQQTKKRLMKKVAIQGIAGSFHDIAAREYFRGEEIEIVACKTFKEVFETIKNDNDNLVKIIEDHMWYFKGELIK